VEPAQLAGLSPAVLKAQAFALLRHLLSLPAQGQPARILAVENAHWIDPTSEEWLASLVERLAGVPLLLLVTYRPGYWPHWLTHSAATQLALTPLSPDESLRVVQAAPQAARLPAQVQRRIVAHGAGNPFFLEELVWAVVDHNTLAQPLALPTTVQAVLAARIDRLPRTAKRLLQTAAVVGHDVPVPLLQTVTGLSHEALHDDLQHLQAAEFLYETCQPPVPTYTFKHALTREAAYQSLLASTRRQIHQRIAQVLEAQFAGLVETQPEVLAHHYRQSGDAEKAVLYLQRAGEQAYQRSAYVEAVQHFTIGVELLTTLPHTLEHARHELDVLISLAEAVRMSQGETSLDYERAYVWAHALCQPLGDTPQLFEVLIGLRQYYEVRGQCQRARELAEQAFTLTEHLQDPARLAEAHYSLGLTLYYLGDILAARAHFEQRIALYEPRQRGSMVHSLSYVAYILWVLGYPDQALQRTHAALTVAQVWSYPFSLYLALYHAGQIHRLRREVHAVQECTEAAMSLAAELGLARRCP
jgi:tetratricopeptide (TPR) repeat protein